MLTAKFQVVEGEFKGRIIFENYLLEHSNPKVPEITFKKLDSYGKAIGLSNGLGDLNDDVGELNKYLETPFVAALANKEPYNGKIDSTIKAFKKR